MAIHAGTVRLARRRNDCLTLLWVDTLDNGDFLSSTGQKGTVANFLDLNHRSFLVGHHYSMRATEKYASTCSGNDRTRT